MATTSGVKIVKAIQILAIKEPNGIHRYVNSKL
jgi:hypothetical protein